LPKITIWQSFKNAILNRVVKEEVVLLKTKEDPEAAKKIPEVQNPPEACV
jgi:hypothetical protein